MLLPCCYQIITPGFLSLHHWPQNRIKTSGKNRFHSRVERQSVVQFWLFTSSDQPVTSWQPAVLSGYLLGAAVVSETLHGLELFMKKYIFKKTHVVFVTHDQGPTLGSSQICGWKLRFQGRREDSDEGGSGFLLMTPTVFSLGTVMKCRVLSVLVVHHVFREDAQTQHWYFWCQNQVSVPH